MNTQLLSGYDTYIIFGAGEMGRQAFRHLRSEGFEAKCFSDNDKLKWETEIEGLPVASPDALPQIVSEEKTLVIIASGYSMHAVSAQMEEMNIPYVFYSMPVFVEITSLCNQKCTFCPYEYIERTKGTLDWELAKSFLYDITSDKSNVLYPVIYPHIMGEPLLCKYFFDFLDLCKELNLYVVVVTNFALMDEKMQERILTNYNNLDIILSLQGPTEKVFHWRKEPKLTYKQWIDRMFAVIDSKFKYGFKGQIQISTIRTDLANDYLICSEESLNVFQWFSSIEEFRQWKQEFGQRCMELATSVKRKYPENYERLSNEELQQPIEHYYKKFCVVRELKKWVEADGPIQFEFLPNVHIYAKKFGLWGSEKFFKSLMPDDKYLYWEENFNLYGFQCGNFGVGVLSSGEIVVCPVDNEAEYVTADLRLGEKYTDPSTGKKQRMLRDDLSLSSICRRCTGRALVFDKAELNKKTQELTHYGIRWHAKRENDSGEVCRASCELSSIFAFPRIDASLLTLDIASLQDKKQFTLIKILSYDDETRLFTERGNYSIQLKPDERTSLSVPYEFEKGKLHRIDFLTATQSIDDKNIGVAVYSACLQV